MISKSFQVSLVIAALVLLLLPANTAAVTCGARTSCGAECLQIIVTTADATFSTVGASVLTPGPPPVESVTATSSGDLVCTAADQSCTFQIQGTLGGGAQSWSKNFTDGISNTTCFANNSHGLPVELVNFTVE